MRTARKGGLGGSFGLLALLLAACSSTPLMRVQSPRPTNEPPKLERVVDMGGLDLPASGVLSEDESDEVATPGEWVALLGTGLSAPGRVVRIGASEVPVQGFTDQGGLLVRVPRGLGPVTDVSVKTSFGETSLRVAVESYVAVADVGASTLRFFPAEGARLGDEFDTIELKGLRGAALSNDGALLYAISYKKDEQGGYRLLAVHMGAKESPAIVGDFEMTLVDPPTALALSKDDRRLFVLSEKSLAVFELEGRVTPRSGGALLLDPPRAATEPASRAAARSLVVLDGGRKVAVLDSLGDRLLFVDTAGAPQLIGSFDLKPAGAAASSPPTSFDIVADEKDPHAVWVLQGPNSRFAGQVLGELTQSGARSLRSLLPGASPEQRAAAPELVWPTPFLRRITLEGSAGRETTRVDLPQDFLPLHLAQGPHEALWVSGLASDWTHVTLDPKSIASAFAKTTEIGRVLQVEPNGKVSTRLSGLLAVLDLTKLPADDTPLYTALRVGMGVKWVAESYKQSSVSLRQFETDWTALVPPYLPPRVLAQ